LLSKEWLRTFDEERKEIEARAHKRGDYEIHIPLVQTAFQEAVSARPDDAEITSVIGNYR
jgi:hypothetical protein